VAAGGLEQYNKVDVYLGEVVVWYQNGGWMELDMSVDLAPLPCPLE
jgi:hypothetical protein